MPGGHVRGMVVLNLPETHVHGAAASALFGEPFGFTQEDVELVRRLTSDALDTPGTRRAASLVARLQALLPPETP